MNIVTVVKILKTSLMLLMVFGPLVFALNLYEWNVSALFTPQYTPPRIDFNVDFKGIRFVNRNLTLLCQLQNTGEVKVELVGMEAYAYAPDMEPIAPVKLEKSVVSNPNSTQNFNIIITFDDYALQKLSQYFQTQGEAPVKISGEIYLRIFGSSITAPIEFTLRLKQEDLGLRITEAGK